MRAIQVSAFQVAFWAFQVPMRGFQLSSSQLCLLCLLSAFFTTKSSLYGLNGEMWIWNATRL